MRGTGPPVIQAMRSRYLCQNQNGLICARYGQRQGSAAVQIAGSGSPRLLRSIIPGTSIRFGRVRSYDRPGRSIVTVLFDTSM
jgi:hypothetical protein